MKNLLPAIMMFGLAAPVFSQGTISLTCGSPSTGSVSKTGTIFNFFGKKDDVLLIRLLVTQANQISSVSIQDTAGTLRAQSFTTSLIQYTVPTDGPFQITVIGQGAGTFQVVYVPIKGSCGAIANMQCGAPRKGSVSGAQLQGYQFTGKAGDNIFLRLVPIQAGSDPTASLTALAYDANQQPISIPANGVFKLKLDGTFSIVIAEASGQLRINYSLLLIDLNGPCGATPVGCGTTVDASIGDTLSTNLYTVNASKGDIFQFKLVTTDTSGGLQPSVQAFDSQGTLLSPSQEASRLVYTAPADGTYTFIIQDQTAMGTGKYTLSIWQLNKPCNATTLSCGTPTPGQIDGPLRLKNYSVDAQAGDVYMLRLLRVANATSFAPRIEIYGPGSGLQVQSLRAADLGAVTFTAATAGAYSLLTYDDSDGKQSGAYTVWMARVNRPCDNSASLKGPDGCGFLAPGSISQALQSGSYSYPTAAGDAFSVRLVDTAGSLQTQLQVFDPRGNAVAAKAGATKAVDVANSPGGAYTVLVTDRNTTVQQGAFSIQAFNTRGACGVNPGQGRNVNGLISGPVPFGAYVLPASAGDMLSVRAAAFTSGFSANVDLYDPNGRPLGSGTSSVAPPALTASGNYTAIVGASAARGAGSYAFSWQRLNDPVAAPLECGQTASASLGSANQFWYYSVGANDGDLLKLLLTRMPAALNAQVELYDPRGTRLVGSTGDIVRKVSAGNYLVVVSPASSVAESGGFGLSLQRPNNPCSPGALACGRTILQQSNAPGELDAFAFSASAGDQISVTVTPRQGSYSPVTELYDQASSTNLPVPGSPGGATLNANITSTSNYTLTVHDRTGNTGSYRVGLQRTNNACPENDTEKPVISLRRPTGGDVVAGGTAFQIAWQSDDNISVASHAIRISSDGGKTFTPITGATALSGVAQSFTWVVPADITPSRTAMIQVTATDKAGNSQTAVSDLLTVIGSGFTPNAQVTYQYDPLNRVTEARYQDGRVVSYSYDAAGNLQSVTVK